MSRQKLAPSLALLWLALPFVASAQTDSKVVDIPTRPGVTQRMLVLTPLAPKAAVVLLAGGHGGLQIQADGTLKWGAGNFLVRSRQLFAEQGMTVVVADAPSDRQSPPHLDFFRQTGKHVADLKAVIVWLRETTKLPVWLIGTSRGTQSAAYVAIELAGPDGPDGVVLTSSILLEPRGRPVTAMALGRLRVPVLVVHHEQDGCAACLFADLPALTGRLTASSRTQTLTFKDGLNTGDPCDAFAYHGFNGIEPEVVRQVADWVLAR
jgi:hypothetical protein